MNHQENVKRFVEVSLINGRQEEGILALGRRRVMVTGIGAVSPSRIGAKHSEATQRNQRSAGSACSIRA
jgi:hypothetical protein